jgi:protein MpaA
MNLCPATRVSLCLLAVTIAGCQVQPPEPVLTPPPTPKPIMHTQTLGTSIEGRPIQLHRFGAGPVSTLILAGIHGDEPTGIAITAELVKLLRNGAVTGYEGTVAIIPVANPDGAAAGRRRNARNVDVNRNFPAANWGKSRKGAFHGGAAPLSEPETVVIKNAVETLRPRKIISVHSITRGRECNNYDGPGEALATRMARHNGYPVRPTIGYPTPGSFGSWAGIDLQIPVITLELPRDLPADQAWEQNRSALISALCDP